MSRRDAASPRPGAAALKPDDMAKLSRAQRAVLDALVGCWLTDTPLGRQLLGHASASEIGGCAAAVRWSAGSRRLRL